MHETRDGNLHFMEATEHKTTNNPENYTISSSLRCVRDTEAEGSNPFSPTAASAWPRPDPLVVKIQPQSKV